MMTAELLSPQLTPQMPSLSKNQDDKKLRQACADFEAIFTGMVFKTMQKSVPKEANSIHGGFAQDVFMDMFIDEIAKISAQKQSNGMANMLYEQLSRQEAPVPEAQKHTRLFQAVSAYQSQTDNNFTNLQQILAPYQSLVEEAAQKYDLSPALLSAVMVAESHGNPHAKSSAGALGLMQLMPEMLLLLLLLQIIQQALLAQAM